MIEVREVRGHRMEKEFLELPLKLYNGNPYFVPPLYLDEKTLFSKKNTYYETCDQVYYNAYKDGVMVGRIQGIVQKQYNTIHNEKRVRFNRFDCIEDFEVAKALFAQVETWAKQKGMNVACGPLGFSDLDREGLLIQGFDQLSTSEEEYNFPYYQEFIEKLGYQKETDWLEYRLTYKEEAQAKIDKLSDYVMERYHLHFVKKNRFESKKHFIDRIAPDFFYLLDEAYKKLYGVVPFTEAMKKSIREEFTLFINIKYVNVIADESGKGIAFGFCLPGIGKALQKSGGKLTPGCLIRLIKALKHPESVDLGLIAVDPKYQGMAINAPLLKLMMKLFTDYHVPYLETNLNLEDNYQIQACWKYFNADQHKRRRAYIKSLE